MLIAEKKSQERGGGWHLGSGELGDHAESQRRQGKIHPCVNVHSVDITCTTGVYTGTKKSKIPTKPETDE